MTALVRVPGLADSLADLFAPVDDGPIAALLVEHAERRATIERVAAVFAHADAAGVLECFARGNQMSDGYTVERMFDDEHAAKAVRALDATYWRRALDATDVLSCMPAKRRDEWSKQLCDLDVPPFTEDALRSTLAEHLASRHRYFAERVDGLFRALSPNHKTNIAAGFRGKMIIEGITNGWYGSTARVDHLADLRIVVARFMGRAIEREYDVHDLTRKLVESSRKYSRGEWVAVDGGAIELRLYANGNCHVRVHDEIAWRLNAVLASVHPGAIPESNCTRPAYSGKRKSTATRAAPTLMLRPLPFAVVRALAAFKQGSRDLGPNDWEFGYGFDKLDKHVRAEVVAVLSSIGGVQVPNSWSGQVRFDYDATEVIREIVASGCVPDQRAHQYYPTPPSLAARVVGLAQIGPDDVVLEPSAGQGAIADCFPDVKGVVIEASALHCAVLRAKGYRVIAGDFLKVTGPDIADAMTNRQPDVTRVVMNPPFDRGQWAAHVEHAAKLLSPRRGARLVAILPASAAKRLSLPGFALSWSEPIDGAFPGVSIAVVILVAECEA